MSIDIGTVAIVDYGMGNLFSVKSACDKVDLKSKIISRPEEIINSPMVILPGVGAFGDAMKQLSETGMADALKKSIDKGNYVVGICLGMQLLMDRSEEFGSHDGLGLISGNVLRFPQYSLEGLGYKIPNVGWRKVLAPDRMNRSVPFPFNLATGIEMYFVHSFYVECINQSDVMLVSNYAGTQFAAGIKSGKILGFQFHPERSGIHGLKIYKGLLDLLGVDSRNRIENEVNGLG